MSRTATANGVASVSRYIQQYEQVKDIVWLPLGEIEPNPRNPRRNFDPASLRELANDIKANGVQQNITVRPIEGKTHVGVRFQIAAGERRWRASKLAEQTHIPARIRILSDYEALRLAMAENIQQESLKDGEEALGVVEMFKLASAENRDLSKRQAAVELGKSMSFVTNRLKIDPEGLTKAGHDDLAELVMSERNVITSTILLLESGLDTEERAPVVAAIKNPANPASVEKVKPMIESLVAQKRNRAASSQPDRHTQRHLSQKNQTAKEATHQVATHLSSLESHTREIAAWFEQLTPGDQAAARRKLHSVIVRLQSL